MNTQSKQYQKYSLKPYFLIITITIIMLFLILLGTNMLVIQGIYHWASGTAEYHSMIIELILYGLFLILSLFLPERPIIKLAAAGITAAVFFWCHAVFVPMLISGLYLLFICTLGRLLNYYFPLGNSESISSDFLYGCATIVTLFCLMSALGIGAIPNLRLIVGILAAILIFCFHKTIPIS